MRTLLMALLLYPALAYGQNCSGCTISIQGQAPWDVNVYPGNTLCIGTTSDILGTIYNYGGTVCNEGKISGDYIQYNGELNNYNEASGTSQLIIFEGTVNNYGSVYSFLMTAHGSQLFINNEGQLNPTELNLNGDSLSNTAVFENHGSVQTTNFHTDTSTTYNYGEFVTIESAHVNDLASFYNYGPLQTYQHYYNNGYSVLYCMAQIAGNLYNNGESSGPPFGCGGYSVDGSAFNNGNFGTNAVAIDLCKTNGPSGFDGSLGTIGSNVTYCSCSNSCTVQTAAVEVSSLEKITLSPNPANTQVTVAIENSNFQSVQLYDIRGNLLKDIAIKQGVTTFSTEDLASGIYLVVIGETTERLLVLH